MEEMFAGSQEDRSNRQVNLVDKSGGDIFPNDGDTASEANILSLGSVGCLSKRRRNPVRYKVEGRSALHFERRAVVVGQDEDRRVIGWIASPPTFPGVIRPGSPHRPEHIAAQD